MSHEPLVFDDITLIEIPVTVGEKKYVLREASEGVATKYRDAQIATTVLGETGKPRTVTGMAETEPLLVHWCLFIPVLETGEYVRTSSEGYKVKSNVPLGTVKSWKPSIVKALHKKIHEISDLTEDTSLKDLVKQKAELDKRIQELEEAEEEESPAKNGLERLMHTSE